MRDASNSLSYHPALEHDDFHITYDFVWGVWKIVVFPPETFKFRNELDVISDGEEINTPLRQKVMEFLQDRYGDDVVEAPFPSSDYNHWGKVAHDNHVQSLMEIRASRHENS